MNKEKNKIVSSFEKINNINLNHDDITFSIFSMGKNRNIA
jgi:hypothetical protein